MFENSAKIYSILNFRVIWSAIKSYFSEWFPLSDFDEITSNYSNTELFFSISVNSGFTNTYLAASRLGEYLATIRLDFKE